MQTFAASTSLLAAALYLGTPQLAVAQPAGHRDDRARQHFQAGTSYMEAEDHESALREFKQAYKLSPRPALLFNVGVAASKLEHFDEAIEAFEAFLASGAAAEREQEVAARLKELRAHRAATPPPEPEADEPPPEPEPEPEAPVDAVATSSAAQQDVDPGWLHWAAVGGGVAVAGAGAALLALGLRDVSTVEDADAGTDWAEVSDANDRAPVRTGAGIALLAVGVAAAGGGLLWWVLGAQEDSELAVATTPFGVRVRGTF